MTKGKQMKTQNILEYDAAVAAIAEGADRLFTKVKEQFADYTTDFSTIAIQCLSMAHSIWLEMRMQLHSLSSGGFVGGPHLMRQYNPADFACGLSTPLTGEGQPENTVKQRQCSDPGKAARERLLAELDALLLRAKDELAEPGDE
jgi:hypothetical protein